MLVLYKFVTEPHPCPYLPGRLAKMEYSYAAQLGAQEYEDLMNAGCRKFGMSFYRPLCEGCRECRPLRVPVERFRPGRSQRRTWKRNQDLEVRLGPPLADAPRLELYNRYHRAQARRKGWPRHSADAEDYAFTFVENPVPSMEISLWEGRALRGVVLADVTPTVVSAVYHYHDPDMPGRGLGTYSILQTIEFARHAGKPWVHLGYYVAGSASMAHKARYRPHEIMDAQGVWREA
ncbi:MAG: arginyltransferase [Planctomycetota bacterium]|nr:arginyltransferase [Planctomycetota bacterium]